jgi:2-oxo-3-hexenedioate decarboxylase
MITFERYFPVDHPQVVTIADRLIDAYDRVHMLDPITASDPSFDIAAAYAVRREIHARRLGSGWQAVGRKIGFTNRSLWPRYGVDRPMWAHIYSRTVRNAPDSRATISARRFVQPRIEPEVVFGLKGTVPLTGDARSVLAAVDWIAAGFEIVQCPFPDWKFQVPDCTAAAGLHAALIVGPQQPLDDGERDRLAEVLPEFAATLYRDGEIVDQGGGRQVLDSPALALQYLARVLASQPESPPLVAGEIVTTGTLTDAWPIAPGTRWRSDYGKLGIPGIELEVEDG